MLRALALSLSVYCLCLSLQPVNAQENQTRETPVSTCMAVAEAVPTATPVLQASSGSDTSILKTIQAILSPFEARITYVGHSTFRIDNAKGLTIATDYSGNAGPGKVPDVVTMNHAHVTHWTANPDPRIRHVLRGWNETFGTPAKHFLQVEEAIIRNVTTDINSRWSGQEPDGNSIFIFELAGLCIGHLGHLHHKLEEADYARIGRLDVLMVPVDGGYTMDQRDMVEVVKRLDARVVLPMHWFGISSLQRFMDEMGTQFPLDVRNSNTLTVSVRDLPEQPTVVLLDPTTRFSSPED